MNMNLCKAYGVFGEARATKWGKEGKRGYRYAYWRRDKNRICELIALNGEFYSCNRDFNGWYSATITMKEAFAMGKAKF